MEAAYTYTGLPQPAQPGLSPRDAASGGCPCCRAGSRARSRRRTCVALALVPYLLLVLLFHTQLPFYRPEEDGGEHDPSGGHTPANVAVQHEPNYRGKRTIHALPPPPPRHSDYELPPMVLSHQAGGDRPAHHRRRVPIPMADELAREIGRNNRGYFDHPVYLASAQHATNNNGSRSNRSSTPTDDHHLLFPTADHCADTGPSSFTASTFQPVHASGHGSGSRPRGGRAWVYTAYLDARLDPPTVRLVALLPRLPPQLYCHFPLPRTGDGGGERNSKEEQADGNRVREEEDTYVSIEATLHEMCENHAKPYGGWWVACAVPPGFALRGRLPPCHVLVSTQRSLGTGATSAGRWPINIDGEMMKERDSDVTVGAGTGYGEPFPVLGERGAFDSQEEGVGSISNGAFLGDNSLGVHKNPLLQFHASNSGRTLRGRTSGDHKITAAPNKQHRHIRDTAKIHQDNPPHGKPASHHVPAGRPKGLAAAVAHLPLFHVEPPRPPSSADTRDRRFGVCVPPLFGHIPSTSLIEFIEMTLLLGGGGGGAGQGGGVHLVFYAHQTSREVAKVLRYYEARGDVSVVPWTLPVQGDRDVWYHGQLLAANDCLLRMAAVGFTYVAFNDVDEFLVPHAPGDRGWADLVSRLESAEATEPNNGTRHCGFSFVSAFFDPLSSGTRVLYDLESDLRTKTFSSVRSKCLVRPALMLEMGIHHMAQGLPGHTPLAVPPATAFLHHYRRCSTDYDPTVNCQVFTRDEAVSPYIPSLRHNVHQTLWTLKEMEKARGWGGEGQIL